VIAVQGRTDPPGFRALLAGPWGNAARRSSGGFRPHRAGGRRARARGV